MQRYPVGESAFAADHCHLQGGDNDRGTAEGAATEFND